MSENQGLDIGRVVGLIMENPALIEQIANLAKSSATAPKKEEEDSKAVSNQVEETPVEASTEPTYPQSVRGVQDRTRLFGALKPYVSKERAQAIDSMLTIADILDMMRAR